MSTFDLLNDCLKEKGKDICNLEKDGVLSKNLIYQYKRYNPSLQSAIKIANYLSLSLDYIFWRKTENQFHPYSAKQAGFYNNLTKILKDLKLSQTDVIKALKLSKGCFSSWKNGAEPKLSTLLSLSDFLKCDLDDLLVFE